MLMKRHVADVFDKASALASVIFDGGGCDMGAEKAVKEGGSQ